MDFDIRTTYNYLATVDDYTFWHHCSKKNCETCSSPDACMFLCKFLIFLEETIDNSIMQ